jgi:hypothetical protein
VLRFKETILRNLDIKYPKEKSTAYLFFPRSRNGENYKPNDRAINYQPVKEILNGKEYTVYDTANTKNLKDQIELLVSSKNIFLDWGSAFMVNMLFCRDSNVYTYNYSNLQHIIKYQPYILLCQINDNNTLHYL